MARWDRELGGGMVKWLRGIMGGVRGVVGAGMGRVKE